MQYTHALDAKTFAHLLHQMTAKLSHPHTQKIQIKLEYLACRVTILAKIFVILVQIIVCLVVHQLIV